MQKILDGNKNIEDIIDLSNYIKPLLDNWFRILLLSILVTMITILIVLQVTPKYTATSTLLIESQEKKAVSIQEVVGIDSTQKEYYQTQFEILKSNLISEKVISRLNIRDEKEFRELINGETTNALLEYIKSFGIIDNLINDNKENDTLEKDGSDKEEKERQMILKAFKDRLTITPVRNTHLVKISFRSEDPKLAASVANDIGYTYIENSYKSRLDATKYASTWITSRLSELQKQLEDSEDALSNYLSKEKLIDDSGIDALASQELSDLTERMTEVRDRRIRLESSFSALISNKGSKVDTISSIPVISNHPQVIEIRKVELGAQNEVRELSKRYGEKHDKMIAAKAKLAAIKERVHETTIQLIDGLGEELDALKKQEMLLNNTIEQRRNDFQELAVKRNHYWTLKREVATNRDILNVFLQRQKETTATQDFDSTNARFTDEALVPQKPSSPRLKIIVLIALFLSLVIFSIITIIIRSINNTIDSVKNFEDAFGIIPLGPVPLIKSKHKSFIIDDNEYEPEFIESIRTIRTSLCFNRKENKKIISITSANPSEGKTTIAINLALSISKLEKTLLIDCDLRNPSVAVTFGIPKHRKGLSNYITMGVALEDCIYKDSQSELYILTAGMLISNAQELLSSKEFSKLLDRLDNEFDRIIIDTPPCLPVSDALIVGGLSKNMLLVVKANSTKIDAINNTLNKIVDKKINIEGVVINQVDKKSLVAEYSYYGYN